MFVTRDADVVEMFAGPGGWLQGARILGAHLDAEGIDISKDAVATARAAGHRRRHADVFTRSPLEYSRATGAIISSPCPTFSAAGSRTGLGDDYQRVLDVWTSIGWGISPEKAMTCVDGVEDRRTALLALAGMWALTLPNLEWLVMEQVPAVQYAFEDLSAELFGAGWEYVDVGMLDSQHLGVPSRRNRAFLVAHRSHPVHVPWQTRLPQRSMAEALGWGPGHKVFTRGNRTSGGGNAYSADGPSWCLTSKARAWYRDDGLKLTDAEAGYLSGFPLDYPWQGSRSSRFQQSGDVVSPVAAAMVLGAALGIDAVPLIEQYTTDLYDSPALEATA